MSWYGNTDPSLGVWSASIIGEGADLREEFNKLVLGQTGYRGIGQTLLLRHMTTTHCACWDPVRGSSNVCKYCNGEGYTYSETYFRGWFTQDFGRGISSPTTLHKLLPPGVFDLDKALIYLPFDSDPKTGDVVFRIKQDHDGKPYYPVERVEKWRAVNVEDRRQEAGEVAFYTLVCERVEF